MARKRNDKPNVIIFFTDQQRWDTCGVHGNPLGLTPNFDRIASQGTHLDKFFTCQPVCAPARSCLQTGMYATNTGVFRNGVAIRNEDQTLAKCFGAAGYKTGYVGKWHLAGHEELNGTQAVAEEHRAGYDYWLGAELLEFCSDAYRTVLYDNDNQAVELPGYRADALTDAAIRFIDKRKDDPFFLCISYIEPHHQNHIDDYPPPTGYREPYTGRWTPPDLAALGGSSAQHLGGYFGMVKRLDETMGRLFDALKSMNLLEDTVVAFVSDHGSHFKTRNAEYKRSCHEACIRIPGFITGPGFFGGGKLRELISLVDLPPTLLDAAGIDIPDTMEGRSVCPLVNREPVEWPEEVFVQISESQVGRAVRTQRWKYGVDAPDKQGWRDSGSDTYVEQYLYDLKSDPYELRNLINHKSHRNVADVMRERLIRRMVAAEEPEPTIELAPVTESSGQRIVSEEEARL